MDSSVKIITYRPPTSDEWLINVDAYNKYMLYATGNHYLAWAQLYLEGLTLKNTISEQRKAKKLAR